MGVNPSQEGADIIDRQSQLNSNETTATIPDTYARAVALDLLAQRHLALATLKQKSALILDAPASQISETACRSLPASESPESTLEAIGLLPL